MNTSEKNSTAIKWVKDAIFSSHFFGASFLPFYPSLKTVGKKCNSVTYSKEFKNQRVIGYTFRLHFLVGYKKSVTIKEVTLWLHFYFMFFRSGYTLNVTNNILNINKLQAKSYKVTRLHFFRALFHTQINFTI